MVENNLSEKRFKNKIFPYIESLIFLSLVTLICYPLRLVIGYQSVSLILIFSIAFLSLIFRQGPILTTSLFSALTWNYFFIPPQFTFYISKIEDILMFFTYFVIAIVTGVLTTRISYQEKLAKYREERTKAIYTLTKELSNTSNLEEVLKISTEEIRKFFKAEILFLFPEKDNITLKEIKSSLSKKELAIATWSFSNNQKCGKFTETLNTSDYLYYPLSTSRSNLGVIGIFIHDNIFSKEQETLLETFIYQISSSIEKELLNEKAKEVMIVKESERLQNTLLNSISHELRTPLATIMWSIKSLQDKETSSDPEVKEELNNEIYLASERLNRLVENLLDMSRLESGTLKLQLKWHDINDLILFVIKELNSELKDHNVIFEPNEELPLIKIDFGLIEQAITNIILNASIYTPINSTISIKAYIENDEVIINIEDNGNGLPEESINKIFDKFYRVEGSKTGGTGIGLSIVKGFVEAHKGTISVENLNKGLRFTIRLKKLI